ncbi:hypothetical protein [Planococcus rifietoensis]|uniref:hypothetical protein n=1 Tax=Planococcus rifietoensis TaxID=200991 RepID=UPI001F3A09C5|nr:hypothetical protein [Planococcus rifietoensis]
MFVHLHSDGESDFSNQYYNFERLPIEDEYLTISEDSEWYQVEMVVHTPFSEQMCAEIFAVQVDHNKVMNKKVKNQSPAIRVLE